MGRERNQSSSSGPAAKIDEKVPLPIPFRKFYEEIVEEKRQRLRTIATNAHNEAKKSLRKLHSDMKAKAEDLKREIAGPPWYRELSFDQEVVLNDLKIMIKHDFEDNSTKRVRRSLKQLGIQTKIPHSVAKAAIFYSKLYPIDFLQAINKYLCDSINKNIKKKQRLEYYTHEERLIISGIVHFGLPSLFMKLNYCLGDPVTEKKLDYIPLKKVLCKKYKSPYLEQFNLSEKSRLERRKIQLHNLKVNVQREKQKLRERVTNEQKKQQDDIIRDIELKMGNGNPIHPLNALFIKPPLDKLFDNEKSNADVVGRKAIKKNKEPFELKLAGSEVPCVISENDVKINKPTCNEKSAILIENNAPDSVAGSEKSNFDDHSTIFPSTVSSLTHLSDDNSYDWQDERCITSPCFDYNAEELEPEETIEDEEFLFLLDGYCEGNDRDEKFVLEKQHEGSSSESRRSVVVDSASERDDIKSSQSFEKVSMAHIMENQSEIESAMIMMFNNRINAFPDYRLHSLGVNVTQTNVGEIEINNLHLTNDEPKLPIELDSVSEKGGTSQNVSDDDGIDDNKSKSKQTLLKDYDTDRSPEIKTEEVEVFNEVVTEIRKLPRRKQLKAALQILADLGDPIACLPNVTELNALNRWYESRTDPGATRPTPRRNVELVNASIKLWEMPRPDVRGIAVPSNPCYETGHSRKWTWDDKKTAMKMIDKTKENYENKAKELVLCVTRDMYPTFKTSHYRNKLFKDFKRTYYSYFPAKKCDVVLSCPQSIKRLNSGND